MRMNLRRSAAAGTVLVATSLLCLGCTGMQVPGVRNDLSITPAPSLPMQPAVTSPASALPAAISRGEALWGAEALARFEEREALGSCGESVEGQPGLLPLSLVECMDDARSTGAELSVAAISEEGDPYVVYYRVGAVIAGVQVFVDSTADPLGGGSWSEWACPTALTINNIDCLE